jgi:hypothetical protein
MRGRENHITLFDNETRRGLQAVLPGPWVEGVEENLMGAQDVAVIQTLPASEMFEGGFQAKRERGVEAAALGLAAPATAGDLPRERFGPMAPKLPLPRLPFDIFR